MAITSRFGPPVPDRRTAWGGSKTDRFAKKRSETRLERAGPLPIQREVHGAHTVVQHSSGRTQRYARLTRWIRGRRMPFRDVRVRAYVRKAPFRTDARFLLRLLLWKAAIRASVLAT